MTIERPILDTAARLRRQREPHLIATVVAVRGAGCRRPGARMLLTQFRWLTGVATGGQLAGELAKQAWSRTRSGDPIVMSYESRVADADDDLRSAFGLGCEGVVDVMVERAGTPGRLDPLEFASACIRMQQRGAIVTVIRSRVPDIKVGSRVAVRAGGDAYADVADAILTTAMMADARAAIASGDSTNCTYNSTRGSVEVFVEAIVPPPRMFVLGTGHDAVPVVQLARSLGWDVTVCTNTVCESTRRRFSHADEILVGAPAELAARIEECDRAVVVVMNHDYDLDRAHLAMLVKTRARYIGLLGPRGRTSRMLDELGLVAQADPRLHAPVGLELGAETPQEVALAILAEVQAVLAHVPAQSLREHVGSIHERPLPRISYEIETLVTVAS